MRHQLFMSIEMINSSKIDEFLAASSSQTIVGVIAIQNCSGSYCHWRAIATQTYVCPAKLDIHIKCWIAVALQEKLTSCLDSMDIIPKNVACGTTVYESFSHVATVQRYLVRVAVTPQIIKEIVCIQTYQGSHCISWQAIVSHIVTS